MKIAKLLVTVVVVAFLVGGCVVTTRSTRFEKLDLTTKEFYGDIRLGNSAYRGSITQLKNVNAIRFYIVEQTNRNYYPQLDNIAAQFGLAGQPLRDMTVKGSNRSREVILLMNSDKPIKNKATYQLRLHFEVGDKSYDYDFVGMIMENVSHEFYLFPLPNAGFSRAMR